MVTTEISEKRYIQNPVLLVIDIQNDFCSDKGLLKKRGYDVYYVQKIITKLKKFIKNTRAISIPVCFIISYYDKKFLPDNIYKRYKKSNLHNLCKKGTWGSKLYKIKSKFGDKIIVKHRYDAFSNGDLERWLIKKKRKSLILTGFQTDLCVDTTARAGFMKGYDIILIEDCLASIDKKNHNFAIRFMENYYDAQIRTSKIPLIKVRKG